MKQSFSFINIRKIIIATQFDDDKNWVGELMKYNLSLKLEVKTLSGASMSMPYLILQFVTPNSQHPVFDVNIDYPSNEDTDFFGTKPIWDILYIGIEGIEKVPKDIQVTLLYKNSPGGIAN